MSLIGLVVFVIVAGLVYWAIHRIAGAFGLPAPIVAVLDVILVVVCVVYLLDAVGWAPTFLRVR